MKVAQFRFVGNRPLIMHNEQLADPLNLASKAVKELSAKRNKTDEEYIELARREWVGGIYHDPEIGPYIPAENIEKCMREGGTFRKNGKKITQGAMLAEEMIALEYDGPRDLDGLLSDMSGGLGAYIYRRTLKIGQQRVVRTRPRFSQWALTFDVMYDESHINLADIEAALKDAGDFIGLGDWRPRYGRFSVELVK